MTNDYKENLLEYLTGNINQGVQSTTPMYTNVSIKDYDDTPLSLGMKAVRCKDGKGNYNGKDLYYSHGGNTISLVNSQDMTVIKTFTTFSSGTSLGTILNLEVDEVGNVYGLDYITVNGVVTYRIILLNNISEISKGQNDYQVILRNSYYIQGYTSDDDLSPTFETFLAKSTESSTYYFAIQDSTGTILMPSTFQINVGSSNTWTRLGEFTFINGDIEVGYIYFDTNDIPIAEYYATEMVSTDWEITKGSATGNNTPTYATIISNIMRDYYYSTISDISNFSIYLFPNYSNNFYMVLRGIRPDGNGNYMARLNVYSYDNGNITKKATYDSSSDTQANVLPHVFRGRVIDRILLLFIGQWSNSNLGKICYSLIAENSKQDYFLETDYEMQWTRLGTSRWGAYKLYDEYIINVIYRTSNTDPYKLITYKTIYNQFNYNGSQYKDKSMLVPQEGLLFDSNNSLIFARSLYNLKVYNNQTMATLNVPYNLLNNETIGIEKLFSKTGYELIENTQIINKNVYENLYINFINAITMQNKNTNEYVSNLTGASRLNQSSGKVLDYENAKATKIRVTYDDDTSYTTGASCTIDNNVGTYSIGVHVPNDKNVQSIEIISNDENTTYQTIANLNLENNKYYIITQDVYVV